MKIRYYGHIAPTGFGRAAIETCAALSRHPDVQLEIAPIISAASSAGMMPKTHLPLARLCKSDHELDPAPDVVIVHTLPWDCARAIEILRPAEWPKTPKLVAYTTWEALTVPPDLCAALETFDQLWLPSAHAARAMNIGDGKIRVLPHAFDEATLEARSRRIQHDGPFQLYYLGAWNIRKNPAAVLRAYAHAFTRSDDVELVIQSSGANATAIRLAAASTGLSADRFPRLRVGVAPVSDEAIVDLHRGADCFVTAAHGEAWNLPAFDAMLAGRMVISPWGLGSDEFLAETSAMRYGGGAAPAQVDVRIKPGSTDIETVGVQGISSRCLWVEPSMPALIGCMQRVAHNRTTSMDVNYDPRERYGYIAVGRRAVSYLREMF